MFCIRFINRAAAGVRGLRFTFGLLNRAAVGWAVSCSAFGFFFFLTAQPQACAGLVLHGFFFNRAAVGWAVYARQAVYFLTAQP